MYIVCSGTATASPLAPVRRRHRPPRRDLASPCPRCRPPSSVGCYQNRLRINVTKCHLLAVGPSVSHFVHAHPFPLEFQASPSVHLHRSSASSWSLRPSFATSACSMRLESPRQRPHPSRHRSLQRLPPRGLRRAGPPSYPSARRSPHGFRRVRINRPLSGVRRFGPALAPGLGLFLAALTR